MNVCTSYDTTSDLMTTYHMACMVLVVEVKSCSPCKVLNWLFTFCLHIQVNPVKRITIDGISQHEWFKEELPDYLFPLPGEHIHTEIDSSVLAEVCQKLSVSPSDVLAAIR